MFQICQKCAELLKAHLLAPNSHSSTFFLIVSGLYWVTALRKNKKEGDSVH
jgi:hypothetical protein